MQSGGTLRERSDELRKPWRLLPSCVDCIGIFFAAAMKRRAEQPVPSEEDEPTFDALVRVIDDLSASRQALLTHSQALTETMRNVGQLHQILSNAHHNATESITDLQAMRQEIVPGCALHARIRGALCGCTPTTLPPAAARTSVASNPSLTLVPTS